MFENYAKIEDYQYIWMMKNQGFSSHWRKKYNLRIKGL